MNKLSEVTDESDVFDVAKCEIDKQLDNLKKVVDSITQMRVQAARAHLELMLMMDVATWRDVARLTALSNNILNRE